jgi:hypothetical protein
MKMMENTLNMDKRLFLGKEVLLLLPKFMYRNLYKSSTISILRDESLRILLGVCAGSF